MKIPTRKKYEITDSVTYSRRWIVWATSEEEALDKANNEGPPDDPTFEEEQTDNTPCQAEEITGAAFMITCVGRTTTLAALLALLGTTATSAQGLDLRPTLTLNLAATADTLTTVWGVDYGSCGGERNTKYWTEGDYRRPDYRRMVIDTAILTGAAAGWQWYAHKLRKGNPDSAAFKWADRAAKATLYANAGYRGYVAARNVARCSR